MRNKNNNQRGFTHQNFIKKISGGFTIIETMISIALFLVVVLVGMNSLLNTTVIHSKSQNMRSIMDNLSFIMEDMSRNLRTGSDYNCSTNSSSPLSCINGGNTIKFESVTGDPENDADQWVYKIDNNSNIKKSVQNGDPSSYITLNPPEVSIDYTNSGFFVYGAEPPTGDLRQPYIVIRLVGSITDPKSGVVTPFALESSVSQRLIDNIIQ